jgi:hypothetical protein
MRFFLVAGLLFLGPTGLAEAPPAEPGFALLLPQEVIDVSTFKMVSGEFTTTVSSGRYRFYVNPKWQSLYQVMRYSLRFVEDGGASAAEKVVFNRHPGEREPLAVWERIAQDEPARWRSLSPGTPEYTLEMGRLMQVLGRHSQARRLERTRLVP